MATPKKKSAENFVKDIRKKHTTYFYSRTKDLNCNGSFACRNFCSRVVQKTGNVSDVLIEFTTLTEMVL